MDIGLVPKLLAAGAIGVTLATALPKAPSGDTVLLRFEWAGNVGKKATESLVLRATIDEPTIVQQGSRTVQVLPVIAPDGNYTVRLQLKDEQESLTTSVRAERGETLMIMGRTKKDGRAVEEKLLFLTVSPA